MAERLINPSRLEGDDLRRWYLRSPEEIERERQDEAARRRQAFFGGLRPSDPDPGFARGFQIETRDPDPGFGRGALNLSRDPGSGIVPHLAPAEDIDPDFSWIPAGENRRRAERSVGARPQSLSSAYSPAGRSNSVGDQSAVSPLVRPTSHKPQNSSHRMAAGQPAPPAESQRHRVWAAGRQPGDLDPSKMDVFQPGPDGKLHPVPGWRTTGPFAFGEWSRMFDWGGVAGDLADTALGAFDFMAGAGLASEIVKGMGYRIGADVVRGRIQRHHPWAKFLGGPEEQHLSELYQSLHSILHRDLAAELKAAGFLRVGGKGGGTPDWAEFFVMNPGKEGEAIEILRRVTKEFDRTNGTKVLKRLDDALARGKTGASPPRE